MRTVVIESPYRAKDGVIFSRSEVYLDRCILDCLSRGESPYASHAICTRVWDDANPAEREAGILAGYPWHLVADAVVFYADYGWSEGMGAALKHAQEHGCSMETRCID